MNTFFGFEVVGSFRLGVCFFHLSKRLDPFGLRFGYGIRIHIF